MQEVAEVVGHKEVSSLMMAYLWMGIEHGSNIVIIGNKETRKSVMNAVKALIKNKANVYAIRSPGTLLGISEDELPMGYDDYVHVSMGAMVEGMANASLLFASTERANVLMESQGGSMPSWIHHMELVCEAKRELLPYMDAAVFVIPTRIKGERVVRAKQVVELIGIDPHSGELLTNEAFRWSPATDEFEFYGKSYVLEEIMLKTNMSKGEITKELKRRQEIIEWLIEQHPNGTLELAEKAIDAKEEKPVEVEMAEKEVDSENKKIKCPRCKGAVEITSEERPYKMTCEHCGAAGTIKK